MHKVHRKLGLLLLLLSVNFAVNAQTDGYVQEGEIGINIGAAHYFGDLNTQAAIHRPKPAIGVFFRKNLHDYIAVRLGLTFAQLGYSDVHSSNEFQRRRNLSFNSNIWEATLQGDFNFMRFVPGDARYAFTPYVTLGFGIFNYNPYTYINDTKVFLRPQVTEGQGSTRYPDRKPYSALAFCIPLGMGVKYNVNQNINVSFELAYRFTTTDYLDDVSTTYAPDGFAQTGADNTTSSMWYLLQDRSYELGDRIGQQGVQRGFRNQKDSYIMATVGVAFNLTSFRCPPVR